MSANHSVWTRSLWSVVAAAAVGLAASSAAAQTTVHLIAAPVTKTVTLPNGTVVSVPMWGYALDANNDGVLGPDEPVTVPGPRIVIPPGDTSLTITLTNLLPEGTSLVIPGQPFDATPAQGLAPAGRIGAMTTETGAGSTATYSFTGLKPGTFLYQSGSHAAVQVQMGLYGAMTKDSAANEAYPGIAAAGSQPAQPAVSYQHEAVLVFSEVDQALHKAVQDGTYGTPAGPTSTVDYRPSIFLINGESYTDAAATIAAGTAGEATLLRILNAGLRTHAPLIDNASLQIVAEDGNQLPFARDQATVLLAAGKTHDVLWTPAAENTYSIYDRTLGLNASSGTAGQGSAGMLAKLKVLAAGTDTTVFANDDSYSTVEGAALVVPATGVLANDKGAPTSATALVVPSHAASFAWSSDGGFTYAPAVGFFGIDSFTYTATNGTNTSKPATVRIAVQQMQRAPTALAQAIGVNNNENVAITLAGTDPNGDPLSFYITALPTHAGGNATTQGTLSYIDPVTKVETPLTTANLHTGTTGSAVGTAIPGGLVIYRPAATYSGPEAFSFVASDGNLYSPSADVSATVSPANNPVTSGLTQQVAVTVTGVTNYRWTLEEDVTYKVIPGVADANTLAVSFHKSYVPVVAAGTEIDPVMVDPTKRYFLSVLPSDGAHSNSGAEIEVGQTAVTMTPATLPLPTARIRVRVFQDNAPLNGMWDSTEPGLAGFQVTIDDAGGTYGMSGGHQSTDAFGNKLGTTYKACSTGPGTCQSYEVDKLGDGFVLTDADGYAVIENLVMGKYTVKVRAPGGDPWVQTSTIEGQPGIDAWVKPNEPQFFTEFGPPGPHVEVGFTRVTNTLPSAGGYTVSGRVTNLRQSRPPAVAQFSGSPFDAKNHTRIWVALNSGATGGSLLYAQPAQEDGTFSIAHVPNGSYQLVVFDKALDIIIGSTVVNVTGAAKNVGDVAVFSWFTNLYAFVFDDTNGDGIHQADEPGMPDQALNIRFRDGSIYQSLSTAENGFKAFNEVFPFFAWMVAEVDYTRFHSTGLTVAVDAGGDARSGASNAYDWQTQMGLPAGLIPPEVLNPQPQPDNANRPFRTESGAGTPFLLLEGFQGFIGQSTVMMWGKAPYAPPGSKGQDINYAPFDTFDPNVASIVPCPSTAPPAACINGYLHDVDADGNGAFDTDHYNGGIAGIVHYGITRAENDPRWAAAENWEPGIADVPVQLWDANRTHLLNEAATDNWNNSAPSGCQWPNNTPYVYQGRTTDCFDGLRNFNQARPALFDGGYAFSTVLQKAGAAAGHEYDTRSARECTADDYLAPDATHPDRGNCRDTALPIPASTYVVKTTVPPGYKLQKEEDKNVDFGDTYVPQQFWLVGYPLADGGPTDAQPAPTVQDNALIAPFCVGQLHLVPPTLSLFPGQVGGAFAGEMRPLCDAKLVTLRDGQQAAPDFHFFTEAPVAGHVYGMVLDDTTNEFDPNAPTFGEKYAVPFIGVSIRDWQGREITRTYSDQYGMYNALVPSTYTINPPEPSGVSPSILAACINPPTMTGPGGTVVPDPHFQKQYSHFCYPLQYLPGKTTYLDTPVVPTGAFTGNGTLPVDVELPNGTPVIALVTGPNPVANPTAPDPANPYGPYIVDRGATDSASRTIVIRSAASLTTDGLTEVPNPVFDGTGAQQKLIKRDYGFGTSGTLYLDGTPLTTASWTNAQITAVVPTGRRTGQLTVQRGTGATARTSVLGITLSVATPGMHAAKAPKVVAPGQSIQAVIDGATPGDLILVRPGVYEQMVIMTKPVRLQGAGALTTAVNVVTTPAESIQAWLDKMGGLLSTGAYSLPNQPAMTPPPFLNGDVAAVVGDEGPGVMVLGKNLPRIPILGYCLSTQGLFQVQTDFATPANEAYCLQNENYPSTLPQAYWRPNARIDGFSLIGASNAPGVLVNGYAHNLEVSNNKIYTNSGTYAGGIQLGHPGAAAPFSDTDAQNDGGSIHNNMVTANASTETGGGGGIVLGTGSARYVVRDNFVAGNLSAGNGGGIAHVGLSPGGSIDANTVVFNESFTQAVGTNGGGIFVGGTPAAAGALTAGSGNVEVTNNLVQGNAASGGDGGGIALQGVNGTDITQFTGLLQGLRYRVRLYNNVITDNVAGLAGGGVSLADAAYVDIVQTTIARNDSTGTAGAAFDRGPLTSSPQPAGVVARGFTPALAAALPGSPTANVRIANSIVWQNRTFYFGPCTPTVPGTRCGIVPVSPTPGTTQYAEIQITARPYWDFAVLGGTGQFSPASSVLTALTGPSSSTNYLAGTNNVTYAGSNVTTAPAFASAYFNTDRQKAYVVGETTGEGTLISVPAALDEGGNFIRPQFGPLSLEQPTSTVAVPAFFGNVHLTAATPNGAALASLYGPTSPFGLTVPGTLRTDFDLQVRPNAPHRGADQFVAPAPTTPVPQRPR